MTFIALESQRESPRAAHTLYVLYCIAMSNPSLTRTSLRLMPQPQWCHGTLKGDPLIPCPRLCSQRAGLSALITRVPPDPSKSVKRSYFLGREHPSPRPKGSKRKLIHRWKGLLRPRCDGELLATGTRHARTRDHCEKNENREVAALSFPRRFRWDGGGERKGQFFEKNLLVCT